MADIIVKVFDENDDFAYFEGTDDDWAEELQIQEVLAASLGIQEVLAASLGIQESPESSKGFCDICMETASLGIQESPESSKGFCDICMETASLGIQESPESSKGFCDICMETKVKNEMFKLENCSDHSFCSDCIAQYVQSKIQDRIFPVTCPALKCRATIEPASCKSIIPEDVLEKWEEGLSESIFQDREKFYCPYKDCSELLIYDQDEDIIECICPVCQRLLCAACGVAWHTGLDCDEFQKDEKNREDDLKVEELANSSKWMKCPHCKHIVQKADGCIHMTCRCGSEFCYICGEIWSESHWSCQISE